MSSEINGEAGVAYEQKHVCKVRLGLKNKLCAKIFQGSWIRKIDPMLLVARWEFSLGVSLTEHIFTLRMTNSRLCIASRYQSMRVSHMDSVAYVFTPYV